MLTSKIRLIDIDNDTKILLSNVFNQNKKYLQNSCNIIFIDFDGEKERLKLRKLFNNYLPPYIILSKDLKIADLAWQVNADYYVNLNHKNWISYFEKGLAEIYHKTTSAQIINTIKLRTHRGIENIDCNKINMVKADGNYSHIILENGNKLTLTKQIGQLEPIFSETSSPIQRFGKSTLINLNKIKIIKNRTIFFYSGFSVQYPQYSKSFIELKKSLLWNH